MFFDLLKAFDNIDSSHKSDIFALKKPILLHACATCSELPSNIVTMELTYQLSSPSMDGYVITSLS